jgi:hypothetical protein
MRPTSRLSIAGVMRAEVKNGRLAIRRVRAAAQRSSGSRCESRSGRHLVVLDQPFGEHESDELCACVGAGLGHRVADVAADGVG